MKRRNLLKASAALALVGCGQSNNNTTNPFNPGSIPPNTNTEPTIFPKAGQEPLSFDFPMITPLPFAHGVASGDPLSDRVIIWTRITLLDYTDINSIPVRWTIAQNPDMTGVVATGEQNTLANRDWTVKVDATGLNPATTYYYQFEAYGNKSIVGRTRTAPSGNVSEIRVAVLSCSSYWSSHWSGYGHIANRNDLDLVIHCGDYIYDFVDQDETIRARTNNAKDVKDATTDVDYRDWSNLSELRRRYALFRSDKNLLRAHQQHPWFIVWDNHDIDAGYGNELPSPALMSTTTLNDTTRAFWEWTPSRPVRPDAPGEFIFAIQGEYPDHTQSNTLVYRQLPMGQLATIIGVDTQIGLKNEIKPTLGKSHVNGAPSLMGTTQYNWLMNQLTTAQTNNVQWKIINNQTWIAPWLVPGPSTIDPRLSAPLTQLQPRWGEYTIERDTLVSDFRKNKLTGTVFVSGDMHGNWAADFIRSDETAVVGAYQSGLPVASPRRGAQAKNVSAGITRASTGNLASLNNRSLSAAVEFAPSSMGRGGADELIYNLDHTIPEEAQIAGSRAVETATLAGNRHVQFMEWVEHGYGIVDLNKDRAIFEFWWQDKYTKGSPDVLGMQMVTWAKDDTSNPAMPKFVNQINDVTLYGMTVSPTSGKRTALPAPLDESITVER